MDDPADDRPRNARDPRAIERSRAFLAATLAEMELDVSLTVRDEGAETVLEIQGPDAALAIGKKGATLDALQLLVNRVAAREGTGAERTYVTLDAEGYRARRERSLTSMAEHLGARCLKEGKVITLEPLSARERRVIHLALARFPGVTTRSEGDGEERRIQIIPMAAPR